MKSYDQRQYILLQNQHNNNTLDNIQHCSINFRGRNTNFDNNWYVYRGNENFKNKTFADFFQWTYVEWHMWKCHEESYYEWLPHFKNFGSVFISSVIEPIIILSPTSSLPWTLASRLLESCSDCMLSVSDFIIAFIKPKLYSHYFTHTHTHWCLLWAGEKYVCYWN